MTLIAIIAVALAVAALVAITVIDGIQDERRIAQQRQGDAGQLAGNMLAGCWVPVLLLVVTLLWLMALGAADWPGGRGAAGDKVKQ